VGLLAKVVKQQRAGRGTRAGTLLTSEMTAAAGTIGPSTAAGPPESGSRKVSNNRLEKPAIFSRDTSNSSRNSQLEH
jgi:hypothetical protein